MSNPFRDIDPDDFTSGAMSPGWHEWNEAGITPAQAARLAARIHAEGEQGRINRKAELDHQRRSGVSFHRAAQ